MPDVFACAQGHRWDPHTSQRLPLVCPVCGDLPLAQEVDDLPGLGDQGSKAMVEKAGPTWSTVDLGPELPIAVFTSTDAWHPERIGALALYCSDGRWGEAFDEFCHHCLHIPRYDRWATPGGPAWLAQRDTHRDFYQPAREQLEFLIRAHELERIVLITHYGCAFYTELMRKEPDECFPIQLKDVHTAARVLRQEFPSIRVETYLAMRRGKCLSFHVLDA